MRLARRIEPHQRHGAGSGLAAADRSRGSGYRPVGGHPIDLWMAVPGSRARPACVVVGAYRREAAGRRRVPRTFAGQQAVAGAAMLIGTMNHPERAVEEEIGWMADAGMEFLDLTLEPPA